MDVCFHIVLPLMQPKAFDEIVLPMVKEDTLLMPRSQNPSPKKRLLKGLIILVVEDDQDTRSLIVQILKIHGAGVEQADFMEMALQILKKTKINVIVSDIGIPTHDGWELIQTLRT